MKNILRNITTSVLLSTVAVTGWAEELVVSFNPGGVNDISARIIEEGLPSNKYVVVNKPGGGSQIAINYIRQNDKLMIATASQVFATNLYAFKNLSYDPDRDLDIIATVGIMPSVLFCNKESGIQNIKDIFNTDKSLSFAIGNISGNERLVTEVLFSKSKTDHLLVPFSGGGNAHVTAVMGGHVDCMFGNYPTAKPFLSSPELTVLISSHDVGTDVKTWQQEFNEPFPLQLYLVFTVPSTMTTAKKQEIKDDLKQAFTNTKVIDALKNSGLFVQLGVDSANIKTAIEANMFARKFIEDNQIELQKK